MRRYLLFLLSLPAPIQAQSPDSLFRVATQALAAGDTARYAEHAVRAAAVVPGGLLDRPFYQYHAARGSALQGDASGAARWLGTMMDEDIEGLMAWLSTHDPAFARVRQAPAYLAFARRMDRLTLRSTAVSGDVHLLSGAGGNVVAVRGSGGTLLVDAGYLPGGRAAARMLGRESVRWVVLTHYHEDHAGGAEAFAGSATLLAHPAAIRELEQAKEFIPGVTIPAHNFAASIQPVTTRRVLALGAGDSVVVVPMPAHTGGDLLAWFPRHRVLVTGDNFLPGANPFLELGGIEDIQAYIAAMGDFLAILHPETVVVPGHGKVATLAELEAVYRKTRDGIEFVRVRKAAGKTLEEVRAEAGREGLPAGWVGRAYRRLRD